jgi:hypothetical protein
MFTARLFTAVGLRQRRPLGGGVVLPLAPRPILRRAQPAWQQAALGIVLIVLLTASLCGYVYQAARINAAGQEIVGLRAEYGRLQRENSNLLAIYAAEQSLARMEPRARAAGFGPAAEVRYVTVMPSNSAATVALPSGLPLSEQP